MSLTRQGKLLKYRNDLSQEIQRRGDPKSQTFSIALADLLPGIAFREIWPLASLNSPLRPYVRDRVANHDYVPRKRDILTAIWLTHTLAGYGEVDHPADLNIVYVGDSASDFALAENLSKCSDNRMGVGLKVTLYLYDEVGIGQEEVSSNFRVRRFRNWSSIEDACQRQLMRPEFASENFLLLDIDRTVLLPRGLCDEAFGKLHMTAMSRFVNWFGAGSAACKMSIVDASNIAKEFPPYAKQGSEYFGDEDARAVACVLLCVGLIDAASFDGEALPIAEWLPSMSGRSDLNGWNRERLSALIEDVRISAYYKDCTLVPYFREMEHEVMLEMADGRNCHLNGHIVRLVSNALSHGWTPVAYSDRPGASVGLTLRSYYRSRPTLAKRSLIEADLPVIFELFPDLATG